MGMIQEFKEFAMKGNVVDLAVGVVIGGAFGKIVDSLVKDIIMPAIGTIGSANFDDMKATVRGVNINYGVFLTASVNFVIVAFTLFMVIKAMNKMKKPQAAPPSPGPSPQEKILGEIRDLLKSRG